MSFYEAYNEVQSLLGSNKIPEALILMEQRKREFDEDPGLAANLKATCLHAIGDKQGAYEVVSQCAKRSESLNPWLYYALGQFAWNFGKPQEGTEAFQKFHELNGWSQSPKNGYIFTHDYFSPNIHHWNIWFNEHIKMFPIRCLEIGSWQGGSSTWLLDNIVSKRGGSLTCIDGFEGSSEHSSFIGSIDIEKMFDNNIARTGFSHLCIKVKGYSQDVLPILSGPFDFIYVDGAHEAKFVIQDALHSWRLLSKGGYMLFDDYDFSFADRPEQNTAVAVDQFIVWFKDELTVVEKNRQMLIRKN